MDRLEQTIIKSLLYSESYTRRALPFLEEQYFDQRPEKAIFKVVKEFITKYNAQPTREAITIILDEVPGFTEDEFKEITTILQNVENEKDESPNEDWLIEETERFCKQRAIHNAILTSFEIINDQTGRNHLRIESIPELLKEALSISFNPDVGHDYFDDAEQRFEDYHKKEETLAFGLEMLDKATNGGLPRKTLNVLVAGTNVGKSLCMCHFAAAHLMVGRNVLYITMELAKEVVAKRIDANLLDVAVNDLVDLPKNQFHDRIKKIRERTKGRLVVQEYPTAQPHAGHFRNLLNELALKKNFTPDVIYIDYINICASSRFKPASGANSYTLVKAISEEIRGLAVEFNVPIVTATQLNRGGFGNSDPGMDDVAESFGIPMTADLMIIITQQGKLAELGQYLFIVEKNRYSDNKIKKFIIGVDKPKMRLYDTEQTAQEDIAPDKPKSDEAESKYKSVYGSKTKQLFTKKNFSDLKVV